MRQIVQCIRSGDTIIKEVPRPGVLEKHVIVLAKASLISPGTERMLVEFGKASLYGKVKAQPERVKQVLDKVRSDGLNTTIRSVLTRLDEPLALGYSNVGTIFEIGPDVCTFQLGDRVVSNGPHAEFVCVPKNLCVRIPDSVSDESASFAVISSIALQSLRLAEPEIGETFVVYGLGLIGLIAVQLLKASGCRVIGIDLAKDRLKLARRFGAHTIHGTDQNVASAVDSFSEGKGADGVIITASAKSDDIIHQSAVMSRKRGRLILVGDVNLGLRRSEFYEKELSFQVSCSYGPGRYDSNYELEGNDYPFSYVRWTAKRNIEACLQLMASGQLDVECLITHRVKFENAPEAYSKLLADSSALGVILKYSETVDSDHKTIDLPERPIVNRNDSNRCAVIGAGNFSKMTLLPALASAKASLGYVADLKGEAAQHLAAKYGARKATSDYRVILDDSSVSALFIAVGHNLHARLICEGLAAGKHVFVEKPLAMTMNEISRIVKTALEHQNQLLMVGFNRRFGPHIEQIITLLSGRSQPLAMTMTINAGAIPADHWVHDPVRGGGRIIGEACHFIDLMVYLTGSEITTVSAVQMGKGVPVNQDKMSIVLGFADGSIGTVNYFANGSKSYPKEILEVFSEGRVIRMENFRRTIGYGFKGFRKFKTFRQDKGHSAEVAAFLHRAETGGEQLIPLSQLVNVTLASFAAVRSANEGRTINLESEYRDLYRANIDKGR